MSNFKLNITKATQTEGSSSNRPEVDWNALNDHVIEAAGTASKARSIPGYISGIYDLGEQERPDFEDVSTIAQEDEEDYIDDHPGISFKTENGKRIMCRAQKPCQQIALAVDFPQIQVDKGQFFGNSNPAPLRLLLNGEFTMDGQRVVGKPFSISETKHTNGKWGFAKNSTLHKLAESVNLLDSNGVFTKDRIGELLGKCAQFQFRVYMKPSKTDPSKKYFTEEIKLAGMVPEGVAVPEFADEYLHGTNMMGENDPDAVKQLRVAVKNTIKRALNYADSDIQHLLGEPESTSTATKAPPPANPKAPAKKATQKRTGGSTPAFDPDAPLSDDDLPF